MKSIFTALVVSISATPALASTFEVLDAKIATDVQDKEAVGEKSSFATGDKAYIWLKVKPEGEKAQLRIRYSIDGREVWTMPAVPVRAGRLWYYKTLRGPGAWKAEVLDDADEVVRTIEFTVTGEPVGAGAGDSTAATNGDFSVVQLELANEVKDREPVAPGDKFAAGSKIYAWMKLAVTADETQLKLRWHAGGQPIYTSKPITVRQARGWRTWTYKTANKAGAWKVEILDANDKVVHAKSFTVE